MCKDHIPSYPSAGERVKPQETGMAWTLPAVPPYDLQKSPLVHDLLLVAAALSPPAVSTT